MPVREIVELLSLHLKLLTAELHSRSCIIPSILVAVDRCIYPPVITHCLYQVNVVVRRVAGAGRATFATQNLKPGGCLSSRSQAVHQQCCKA